MLKKEEIEEFFDELAVDRNRKIREDTIIDYEQRMRQYFLKQLLDLNEKDFLMDAGCGDCRDAIYFIGSGKDLPEVYLALDFSRIMLKEGMKKTDSKFLRIIQGDLIKLPLKNNIADKIVCSEVLEHIPDWKAALSELTRILKPKGELLISTPNVFSMYYPQKKIIEEKMGNVHPYDEWKSFWELEMKLIESGFNILEVRGCCFLPGLLSYSGLIRRLVEKMLGKMENFEKNLLGASPLKYFGYIIIIKAQKRK